MNININEIIKKQMEFDKQYKSTSFSWDEHITDDNIEVLEFLIISIIGELGETANLVKKIIRGDQKLDKIKDELSEEIIDTLIYLIKLIYQLDIDVAEEYNKKMAKNSERFAKYKID